MNRKEAIDKLIAQIAANVYNPTTKTGVWESDGSNRSPFIDEANKLCGVPLGSPWCASSIALHAKNALGSVWMVPFTAGCDQLMQWGKNHKVFHQTGKRGDIFLVLNAKDSSDAIHTGIVTNVSANGTVSTLEGNTTDGGSPEGKYTMARTRTDTANLVFVRWADLLLESASVPAPTFVPATGWTVNIGNKSRQVENSETDVVRFVGEALGAVVTADGDSRTIRVTVAK